MQALGFIYAASSKVQPFVPIMQATASTGTTVSWLWRTVPGWLKLLLGLALVAGLVYVVVRAYQEVQKFRKKFYINPKLNNVDIKTDFLHGYVSQLIQKSKECALKSAEAARRKQKEDSFAHACASATFLVAARAVLPTFVSTMVPNSSDLIEQMDEALKHKFSHGLPKPVIVE